MPTKKLLPPQPPQEKTKQKKKKKKKKKNKKKKKKKKKNLVRTDLDRSKLKSEKHAHTRLGNYYAISKTRLFKYIKNFTTKKRKILKWKIQIFFHIPAHNINCGYSLGPPRRGGSRVSTIRKNVYTPVNPNFKNYVKEGLKGVRII